MKIRIVGGPADGKDIERPNTATVNVPIRGDRGFSNFAYTLRQCRNQDGEIVELLAPAGLPIDPRYLFEHKLKN